MFRKRKCISFMTFTYNTVEPKLATHGTDQNHQSREAVNLVNFTLLTQY